jgi:hypothetical protein
MALRNSMGSVQSCWPRGRQAPGFGGPVVFGRPAWEGRLWRIEDRKTHSERFHFSDRKMFDSRIFCVPAVRKCGQFQLLSVLQPTFLRLPISRKNPSQSMTATSRVVRTNLRQKTMIERSLYSNSATGILTSTTLRRRMAPGFQ